MVKQNRCYNVFCVCFALLFLFVAGNAVVNNQTPFYTFRPFLLACCVLGACTLLLGAYRLWCKYLPDFSARRETWAVGGLLLCYFLVQLVVAYCMEVAITPGWDFGIVFGAARDYVLHGALPQTYFAQFPNNAPAYVLLVWLFRALHGCGVTNFVPAALCFNALVINVSLLLFYLTLRCLWGRKNALFGLVCSFLCLPFLLYGPIVYTDTLTLPFPIGAALLWVLARARLRASSGSKRAAYALALGASAVCAAGAKLKITVAIVLIAMLLDALFVLRGRIKWAVAGCAACMFICFYGLLGIYMETTALLPRYNKEDAVPYTHWVMMGLSGVGGYHNDDYTLTLSGKTFAQRQEITTREISRRVAEMGPAGLVRHCVDKLGYIYGDGTCYAPYKLDQSGVRNTPLRRFFLFGFPYFGATAYFSTGLQLAILLYCAIGAVKSAFVRSHAVTFARVAVCGLTLFLLLWEARSRYLVNFLPLFLLCGLSGLFTAKREHDIL